MLTTSDLNKIGDLIDKKLESKLEEKLESKLEEKFGEKLKPITNDISILRKDIKDIKGNIKKLENGQKIIINFFYKQNLVLTKRIKRVEDYLKLPVTN